MWTCLAAVLGGSFAEKRGWLIGLAGLVFGWGTIVMYQYIQAPRQVSEMARVVGALAGGLPAAGTYALTLLVAALLGAAGGAVGAAIRPFFKKESRFA
jgi:hypothetical protein